MGSRIRVQVVRCGRCRKPRGLVHVCVAPFGRRPGRTRIRPRMTVECPRCKRRIGNPITHVCKTRTNFKRKAAAAKKNRAQDRRRQAASLAKVKRARSGLAGQRHDYRTCRDEHCGRAACVAYRDGLADCPLEHA